MVRSCNTGKNCGDSCISVNYLCHKNPRPSTGNGQARRAPVHAHSKKEQVYRSTWSGGASLTRTPDVTETSEQTNDPCTLTPELQARLAVEAPETLVAPSQASFVNRDAFVTALEKFNRYGHWASWKECPVGLKKRGDACSLTDDLRATLEDEAPEVLVAPEKENFSNPDAYKAAMRKWKRYGHWASWDECPVRPAVNN